MIQISFSILTLIVSIIVPLIVLVFFVRKVLILERGMKDIQHQLNRIEDLYLRKIKENMDKPS